MIDFYSIEVATWQESGLWFPERQNVLIVYLQSANNVGGFNRILLATIYNVPRRTGCDELKKKWFQFWFELAHNLSLLKRLLTHEIRISHVWFISGHTVCTCGWQSTELMFQFYDLGFGNRTTMHINRILRCFIVMWQVLVPRRSWFTEKAHSLAARLECKVLR